MKKEEERRNGKGGEGRGREKKKGKDGDGDNLNDNEMPDKLWYGHLMLVKCHQGNRCYRKLYGGGMIQRARKKITI